jgi:hypothetical protein
MEIQRSVPPPNTRDRALALDRALQSAHSEAERNSGRKMVYMGSRLEEHPNGTCVLYASYEPDLPPTIKPTPPLNPHNLNEADQYVLGQKVDATKSLELGLGTKENKF